MSRIRSQWFVTALVAVSAIMGTLLCVKAFDDPSRYVYAQSSEGSASYVVGLVGTDSQRRLPLFLIDTRKRAIMVYEYDQGTQRLQLRAVRTFIHDSEVVDDNFDKYSTSSGPSVDDVKKVVRDQM